MNYALGGVTPGRVAHPENAAAVARTLRAADRAGEAVALFGGGTLQALAAPPSRYALAVSLGALTRTLEHEVHDFTIAVEAGKRLDVFARELAAAGQFLPLDAPRASEATVGGTLAAGWLGPRRARYRKPRDFLIGTSVALVDGTLARSGGMVVKNVTGYDTSRLYAGSMGTLAAIVRANFKVLALPQARRMALAALPERTRERAITHVAALRPEPSLVLCVRGFDGEIAGRSGLDGRIAVLFEGSHESVDASLRALRSALGAAGVPETSLHDDVDARLGALLDAYIAPLDERSVTYCSFGHPASASDRTTDLARLAERYSLQSETICDPQNGDALVRVSAPAADALAEAAIAYDRALHAALPRVRILAAPDTLRAQLQTWTQTPSALKAMIALKRNYDPRATLGPGRFAGGI